MDTKFSKQFADGLREHGLNYETARDTFRYVGGNKTPRHQNYFKLVYKNNNYPPIASHCICSHPITENCYITNGDRILILGNCCIKRFIPKATRTCEVCGDAHKNRIVNRCHKCRFGRCDICNKSCGEYYTKCYGCARR